MSESIRDALFWLFSVASVLAGWRVFRTDSMVRAAFWLLGSFVGMGGILLLLEARFLGLVLVLMMAGEMTIMAVFMVMFMMNPAGLNPMMMVHQHRTAVVAGTITFLGLAAVGTFGEFPARPLAAADRVTADLGIELLGDSMLVFETAGVTLLAAMIGSIALASRWGRYGTADDGSEPPTLAEYARASAAELREPESEKHGPRHEHDSRDGHHGGGA